MPNKNANFKGNSVRNSLIYLLRKLITLLYLFVKYEAVACHSLKTGYRGKQLIAIAHCIVSQFVKL